MTQVTEFKSFKVLADSFGRYGLYLFLLAIIILGGLISPNFVSMGNIKNMLIQLAPLGIVVIGQSFVIISRGLDLSVASVMATSAVIATQFSVGSGSILLIILSSTVLAVIAGTLNGMLVTKRSVSPFLATLATGVMLEGFRYWLTSGAPSGNVPSFFKFMGTGSIGKVPVSILIFSSITFIFYVIIKYTVYGRSLYIVGNNPVSGRLVGFSPDRTIILAYVISSFLAAIAGLMLAGYVGVVDNSVGKGFELDSIVAAVIGGVALSGGRGGILGAVTGAAILTGIFNLVLLIGAPVQLQMIIKGLVIIFAAAFYVKTKK